MMGAYLHGCSGLDHPRVNAGRPFRVVYRHVGRILKPRTVQEELGKLAVLATGGDADALGTLVRHAAPRVHRWALVQTGDGDLADDVTQEVLIHMVASLDSLRQPERIETWLYRATRNAAVDLFRKSRRHAEAGPLDAEKLVSAAPGPEEHRAGTEIKRLLASLFQQLPRRQREVFDLVELQGMTAAQAAELLGIRPATVRVNLFKARAALRRRLIAAGVRDDR